MSSEGIIAEYEGSAYQDQLERLLLRALVVCQRKGMNGSETESDGHEVREDEASKEDEQLAIYLAASFEDALKDSPLFAARSSWLTSQEWASPVVSWLAESDQVAHDLIENDSVALEALIEGFFALFSLKPAGKARFAVGDRVLAILKQDSEWHEARVEKIDELADSEVLYHVRLVEYGAPQTVTDEDISISLEWINDTDSEDACKICQRVLPLTFHHLIPRETHTRVMKRGAKELVPPLEALYSRRMSAYDAKSRKDWLDIHGINVCRQCHNAIHRADSNLNLALKLNTLELVLQHPDIIRWRGWAKAQV